jgi:pilus assembly protein CpaB
MLLRILLFVVLAVGTACVGAVAWTMLPAAPPAVSGHVAKPVVIPKVAILAAARSLRPGSLIKPEDLGVVQQPANEVPSGASQDTPQERAALTGAMVRRPLGESQPILAPDVVRPGDHGFLAAVLGPEMRAVTIGVDVVSGTAGLIWPGDRVDVILTQSLDDPSLSAGRRVAAQTVLSGARVIAIDQQMVQGQVPEGATPPGNRTVTLEVSGAAAERVLVAAKLGHLSLSVLSSTAPATGVAPPQDAAAQADHVTWAGDVSPALGTTDAHAPPTSVHVFQGDADSKEFHF